MPPPATVADSSGTMTTFAPGPGPLEIESAMNGANSTKSGMAVPAMFLKEDHRRDAEATSKIQLVPFESAISTPMRLFSEHGRKLRMRTIRVRRTAALLLFLLLILSADAFPGDISQSINVESRLPVYRNTDTALMVFERTNAAEEINITMSFMEQKSKHVPAAPMEVVLSGNSTRSIQPVDIRNWPDGEYKVFVSEKGTDKVSFVRGIRKETAPPPAAPKGPFSVGGEKLFFVDDWYFAETSGLKRETHAAEIIPIEPWKTIPDIKCVRNSIRKFWVDQEGFFNVNILAQTSSLKTVREYWVRTKDFKTWELIAEPLPINSNCSLKNLSASTSDSPPGAGYGKYDPAVDGPVDLSQVRVTWSGTEKNTMWGDIPIPFRSRTAVWEKPGGPSLVLGPPITIDKNVFRDDEIGDWADSNDNFGEVRLSPDGRTLRCYQARLIPRHDPFLVHYDNNASERILVTWSSTDGINWTPSYFDTPTLEDPWSTQHYGVDMWSEENHRLEFAYHKIYDAQSQKLYTEVVFSRDGRYWNRMDDAKPFLETGAPGTFNYGFSITTGNRTRMTWDGCYYEPMQCVNVLHFMFLMANKKDDRSELTPDFLKTWKDARLVGERGIEHSPVMIWHKSWEEISDLTRNQMFTPAFMRYRIDGWIGALPKKRRAEITTKVLLANQTVGINAKTEADGYVMVEVLDQFGNALPEYSKANGAVFKGDQVNAPLAWSDRSVKTLPSGPFKLRITLEKAEIFTLAF